MGGATRPRNIVFAMLSEAGHHTGTFRLARCLRARGHRVVYFGMADLAKLVGDQGFELVPFAEDLLPAGSLSHLAASRAVSARGIVTRWRKRWADERLFTEYLRRVEDGRLDACLLSCRPDVLLCDTFLWHVAIRALRGGIPTLNISIILSLYPNPHIPPIVSSFHPRRGWRADVSVPWSWRWLRFRFFFTRRLASVLLGRYRHPTRMHHLVGEFLRIASRSGYPCEENRTYWLGEMGPHLSLPEIVLCPRAFQLPGAPEDGRRYVGDFVDVERREEPLGSGSLAGGKPLVFCSLGTSPSSYPHARRFFRAVVGASRLRKDWQFVLHVGDHPAHGEHEPAMPNLLICERVPQLALLRDASVMVTHGGLNSIMECIHFQVPMVIVPGLRDQPGNAARAVHHGLAITSSMARITPGGLVDLIARAMVDRGVREGLARMKRQITAEKGLEGAVQFIETYQGTRAGCRDSASHPGR